MSEERAFKSEQFKAGGHVLIYVGILMSGTGNKLHIWLMDEMVFTHL